MKKGIILIFILLLILPFIHAVVNSSAIGQNNPSNINTNVNVNDLQANTNKILTTQLTLHPAIEMITRILFGVRPPEKLDISDYILLICLWIFCLMFIHEIIKFMTTSGFSWILTIILNLLIAAIGAIRQVEKYLLDFGNFLKVLQGWAFFKLILAIIIIGIFYLGLRNYLAIMRGNAKIDENKRVGHKVGFGN